MAARGRIGKARLDGPNCYEGDGLTTASFAPFSPSRSHSSSTEPQESHRKTSYIPCAPQSPATVRDLRKTMLSRRANTLFNHNNFYAKIIV